MSKGTEKRMTNRDLAAQMRATARTRAEFARARRDEAKKADDEVQALRRSAQVLDPRGRKAVKS